MSFLYALVFSSHGHTLLTVLSSTTGIEEPSLVLRDTGEQNCLSSGATAEEAQLHLDRKRPFASCLTVGHTGCPSSAPWQLREEGRILNAEPVLTEQVASSSAPRPLSTHTSPMSVWSSYPPRTLALPSAQRSEVDRHSKASEPSLLSPCQLWGLMLII